MASVNGSTRSLVRERTVDVEGHPARVFHGGGGEPLLLVHGGWGGALAHWGKVLEPLAETFEVIAPDLPGIGRTDQKPLASLVAYACWTVELLDRLGVTKAHVVGNSFGASVASEIAVGYPERCRSLVLVNGFPMPKTPTPLHWLGRRAVGHRVMETIERRLVYTEAAVARAFVDPANVPEQVKAVVRAERAPQADAFATLLVEGGSPERPPIAPLLLWGERDELFGTRRKDGEKLHASWPGSTLVFVPRAGHMPQIENPEAFVRELRAHLRGEHGTVAAA